MSSEDGGAKKTGETGGAAAGGGEETARLAPTEQQRSEAGTAKRFAPGQTVCNERNEKGKLCNGHLKQLNTQHAAEVFLRGDDALHRCQTCGALYSGPPLGHVRDPRKQRRYVESDLAAILRAAGGTLPAYSYPEPDWRDPAKSDALALANSNYETAAEGAATKERARPAANSSPSADRHRPAAEAQAATGQASAAPLSPTAATASPASGAETVSDLAPEASTEQTPGAPRDGRGERRA
ncbi:MAG TPA: hypothetical protein VEY09_16615 [Pyrinomonadaceae bacterium]|nr:hypothetical protein [Pyrinomonadaceae bacterium]